MLKNAGGRPPEFANLRYAPKMHLDKMVEAFLDLLIGGVWK